MITKLDNFADLATAAQLLLIYTRYNVKVVGVGLHY